MNRSFDPTNTDARLWAHAFMQQFQVFDAADGKEMDEGSMIEWFANAIGAGRDMGFKEGMAEASAILR